MIARLGFSIATEVRADILACDEILSVGDFMFQQKCEHRIQELIAKGTTVLIVSHDHNQIKRLCNRALWIEKSELQMIGEATAVCDAYVSSQEAGC